MKSLRFSDPRRAARPSEDPSDQPTKRPHRALPPTGSSVEEATDPRCIWRVDFGRAEWSDMHGSPLGHAGEPEHGVGQPQQEASTPRSRRHGGTSASRAEHPVPLDLDGIVMKRSWAGEVPQCLTAGGQRCSTPRVFERFWASARAPEGGPAGRRFSGTWRSRPEPGLSTAPRSRIGKPGRGAPPPIRILKFFQIDVRTWPRNCGAARRYGQTDYSKVGLSELTTASHPSIQNQTCQPDFPAGTPLGPN